MKCAGPEQGSGSEAILTREECSSKRVGVCEVGGGERAWTWHVQRCKKRLVGAEFCLEGEEGGREGWWEVDAGGGQATKHSVSMLKSLDSVLRAKGSY